MAYDGDDDYHQLGMFSMINGVDVKIGEKFKLPERISLPVGWHPSDPSESLRFEYNFWTENEVISRAEEERLIQVQMKKNIEQERSELPHGESNVDVDDDEEHEDDDSPNTSTDSNVTEILTPLVVPSEGVENKLDEIHQKINVEEFEDHNQNPFELVELQTLNEYDELRSVLEPSAKCKKVVKSKDDLETNENFELDANFFSNVDLVKPLPSISNENFILNYSDDETNVSEPIERGRDAFNMPIYMSRGTLNWTKFNKDTLRKGVVHQSVDNTYVQSMDQLSHSISSTHINGQVPFIVANEQNIVQLSNSIPNGQNPAMMPHEVSSGHNIALMSHSVTDLPNVPLNTETSGIKEVQTASNENIPLKPNLSYGQMLFMSDNLPRTKSLPELEGKTDQIFNPSNEVTPIPANNFYQTDQSNQLKLNIDRSQVDNVVSTDRIDSIMKQYQFQRLPNMPPASNYNPVSTQISNLGGNLPHYVGLPGFTPNTVSTNVNVPTESFSNTAPLPFSIQDASTGIHSTVVFNPSIHVNSISSADVQKPLYSVVNKPPSNFQGVPANVPNVPKVNTKISTGYQSEANPFTQTNIQNQNNSQVPTSIYRHGILPPLPIERSHLASNFNPAPQSAYNPTYSMSASSQLTETDLRVSSQSPLLPSISSQETLAPTIPPHNANGMTKLSPSTQESLSWLPDPTEDLPLNQKNFAYQVSAMGFSMPCVSRTILRLGVDEKEVLDFLCSVQDLIEKDFHSDDVEMALLNLQNEKEKVTSYLQIVSTLKELGFKPSEIHNALIKTSVDQNKAIDYLTSSR